MYNKFWFSFRCRELVRKFLSMILIDYRSLKLLPLLWNLRRKEEVYLEFFYRGTLFSQKCMEQKEIRTDSCSIHFDLIVKLR